MALKEMRRVTRPIVSSAMAIMARRSGGMKIVGNRCPLRYECRLRSQSHLHILAYRDAERNAVKRNEI